MNSGTYIVKVVGRFEEGYNCLIPESVGKVSGG